MTTRALRTTGDLAVEASGLTKVFGRTRALDGVDLTIPRGSVYGVLGPNGAGKTTIFAELGLAVCVTPVFV